MHIHARIYRLPESVLVVGCRAVQVVNMLDVHPVADDETFESPLSAHHVLHQPAVRVARNAVQLIVCGHHRVGSGVDARFERGGEEYFPYHALREVRGRTVGSVDGLAASHEVFHAGEHAPRFGKVPALIAPDRCRAHYGYQIGVFAESFAHAAPARVSGNLYVRVEGPLRPGGAHLGGRLLANPLYEFGIERRCLSDTGRVDGASGDLRVAVNGVDSDEQRDLQRALACESLEIIGLLGRQHMQEGADLAVAGHLLDVGRGDARIESSRRVVVQLLFRQLFFRRFHMLQTYPLAHLGHLLFEGHTARQVFGPLLRRLGGVLVKRGVSARTACQRKQRDDKNDRVFHRSVVFSGIRLMG